MASYKEIIEHAKLYMPGKKLSLSSNAIKVQLIEIGSMVHIEEQLSDKLPEGKLVEIGVVYSKSALSRSSGSIDDLQTVFDRLAKIVFSGIKFTDTWKDIVDSLTVCINDPYELFIDLDHIPVDERTHFLQLGLEHLSSSVKDVVIANHRLMFTRFMQRYVIEGSPVPLMRELVLQRTLGMTSSMLAINGIGDPRHFPHIGPIIRHEIEHIHMGCGQYNPSMNILDIELEYTDTVPTSAGGNCMNMTTIKIGTHSHLYESVEILLTEWYERATTLII